MDREETKKIIAAMIASYPNFKPFNMSVTVDTWTAMLSEYSYRDISLALKSYIVSNTSGFAPSIGQLIGELKKPEALAAMGAGEAWALVNKALRRSTYYSIEEFEKLPADIQAAVGEPSQLYSWATDENFNESVVSSNFRRSYESVLKRKNELASLPAEMAGRVQALRNETILKLEAKDG